MLCPVLVAYNIAFLGSCHMLAKPHSAVERLPIPVAFKPHIVTHQYCKELFGGRCSSIFFFNEKLFLGRATKNSECILYSKSNLWFVKFLFQLFLGMSEPWYRMYFRLRSWSKPHCLSVQMTALRHGKFLSQGFNYVPAYCLRNSTVY